MELSEYGLRQTTEGADSDAPYKLLDTEEQIFSALGMPFMAPHER
jgi:DNA polymerase/3'-5' exonuclease PolX